VVAPAALEHANGGTTMNAQTCGDTSDQPYAVTFGKSYFLLSPSLKEGGDEGS
jgi:hypothetical protein